MLKVWERIKKSGKYRFSKENKLEENLCKFDSNVLYTQGIETRLIEELNFKLRLLFVSIQLIYKFLFDLFKNI